MGERAFRTAGVPKEPAAADATRPDRTHGSDPDGTVPLSRGVHRSRTYWETVVRSNSTVPASR